MHPEILMRYKISRRIWIRSKWGSIDNEKNMWVDFKKIVDGIKKRHLIKFWKVKFLFCTAQIEALQQILDKYWVNTSVQLQKSVWSVFALLYSLDAENQSHKNVNSLGKWKWELLWRAILCANIWKAISALLYSYVGLLVPSMQCKHLAG